MMADAVTFADLERLLLDRGFVGTRPAHTHLLYTHPSDEKAMFMFPPRSPDEPVDAHHIAEVRHHLVWWGLIEEDDFERWLCQVRFGTECREPAGSVAGEVDGRTTG